MTVQSTLPECDSPVITVSAIDDHAQVTSEPSSGASLANFPCFCEGDFESGANEG